MLSYSIFSERIQKILNDNADSYLTGIEPGVKYRFRIISDTGEYLESDRDGNDVTTYIQGVLLINGAEPIGTTASTLNVSVNTTLNLTVPFITDSGMDEGGEPLLCRRVRELLDFCFSVNDAAYITVDGDTYYLGTRYSATKTGERELRPQTGESINISAGIDFFVISNGIGSTDVVLTIGGITVRPEVFGETRKSVMEGNVPSNAQYPIAKSTVSHTVYSIHFDARAIYGAFDTMLDKYLHDGVLEDLTVTITKPVVVDGVKQPKKNTYIMQFSSAGFNTQQNYCASVSVEMTEVIPTT